MLALQIAGNQPISAHSFGFMELGVFVALVAQVGAFFYWGGKLREAIDSHEKRIKMIEEKGSLAANEAGIVAAEVAEDMKELRHRLEDHILSHMKQEI